MYDLGNFQFATVGLAGSAGQVIGELWITYRVALFKPILIGGGGSFTTRTAIFNPITTPAAAGLAYFGAGGNPTAASNLACTTSAAGVLTFPANIAGRFLVWYWCGGTSATLTNAIAITVTGATTYTQFGSQSAGAVSSNAQFLCQINIAAPSATPVTLAITAGTLPAAVTTAYMTVAEINPNNVGFT
jgi:hypothetical protein